MEKKPLFIPLKAEHYIKFEKGEKDTEYRAHGPRWNEKTCYVGRLVTLSYGYGKARRLSGVVVGFSLVDANHHPAIRTVYHVGDEFAAIKIKINQGEPQ